MPPGCVLGRGNGTAIAPSLRPCLATPTPRHFVRNVQSRTTRVADQVQVEQIPERVAKLRDQLKLLADYL